LSCEILVIFVKDFYCDWMQENAEGKLAVRNVAADQHVKRVNEYTSVVSTEQSSINNSEIEL